MLAYHSMERQKTEQCGKALAKASRFDEVFEPYRTAFIFGDLQQQSFIMNELVSSLLSRESVSLSKERGFCDKPVKEMSTLEDIFTCILCQKLFHVPVTLICGHTFCLGCLGNYQSEGRTCCPSCSKESELNYTTSIAVRELSRKYFPDKVHIRNCTAEASRLMRERRIEESVQLLQSLLVKYPDNVDLLQLRCRAFKYVNRYSEALKDIDLACSLNPYSGEILFQRGEVLASLNEPEEAVNMFVRASALKANDPTYRHRLTTYLESILRNTSDSSSQSRSDVYYTRNRGCNSVLKGLKIGYEQDFEEAVTTARSKKQVCRQSELEDGYTSASRTLMEIRPNNHGNIRSEEICRTNHPRELEKDNLCDETDGEKNISQARDRRVSYIQRNVIKPSKLNVPTELECKLCYNVMYEPVTTSCGHSLCRSCLKRCLDHRFECPCCRTSLHNYLEHLIIGNIGSCQVLEKTLLLKFKDEYEDRKACHEKELLEFARSESSNNEIPIFVCTLAVPGIACPLHIFEPRYKLMIRRCLESGSRQFGMCVQDPEHGFSSVGTMLCINDVNFLPDGRSIVHTVGGRRFEVLERGLRDGYNTAKVLWLEDECNEIDHTELHNEVYKMMTQWFDKLPREQQACIVKAVGPIPDVHQRTEKDGPRWLWWLLVAMPLNSEAKQIILSMTSVTERLQSSKRFLAILLRKL